MPAERLRGLLEDAGVAYTGHEHERAVTAQELAAAEAVTGWRVAKPVLLSVGGRLVMAVLPAPLRVDLDKAARHVEAEVRLASEDEFAGVFGDSETGAEPPFGTLYDVPTYIDDSLLGAVDIVFRDGTHTGTITMRLEDYLALVQPRRVDIAASAD